ncbi:hypothetical protein KIPB_017162, partial [Kipferlia bialata]
GPARALAIRTLGVVTQPSAAASILSTLAPLINDDDPNTATGAALALARLVERDPSLAIGGQLERELRSALARHTSSYGT